MIDQLGFEKGHADDCLYILRDKSGEIIMLVLVYVDDMGVAAKQLKFIQRFKDDLRKRFDITDLGELHFILGIQAVRDRSAHAIYLNQTAYIHATLDKFGMGNCTPTSTPLAVKERLTAAQSPSTLEEKADYKSYAHNLKYLESVGAVLYVTQIRPDIQHAIGVLAQFGANPGKPHLEC